jgi:hypothetical protein
VLLSADLELAAEPVRGARQPGLRVAPRTRTGGSTKLCAANASRTSSTAGSGSMSSATARAALRACITVSATTRPMTRPTCSTVSMAKMGSSWAKAARTGSPGMSCASTTPRTPGIASAGAGSTPFSRPCATGERMGAACSVPRTSAMSST